MKNYTDSDYALNKTNKSVIVYKFADGIVEVTLADYLAENPDKTKADFDKLKTLSDTDYLEQDRKDYRHTYKNVSLYGLDETNICAAPPPEDGLNEQPEQAAIKKQRRDLGLQAFNKLTKIQQRRYLLYHVKGLTIREIAEIEGAHFTVIHESLQAADKKIKKVLSKG